MPAETVDTQIPAEGPVEVKSYSVNSSQPQTIFNTVSTRTLIEVRGTL
jgi:hypothetical protein